MTDSYEILDTLTHDLAIFRALDAIDLGLPAEEIDGACYPQTAYGVAVMTASNDYCHMALGALPSEL